MITNSYIVIRVCDLIAETNHNIMTQTGDFNVFGYLISTLRIGYLIFHLIYIFDYHLIHIIWA